VTKTPQWRPRQSIRPIAIAIIWRGSALLLAAVRSDDGAVKGWRPLGGGIEFGERAADALKRELAEELGVAIAEPRLLATFENIYEHHGAKGHEIAFAFETTFLDAAVYGRDKFEYLDGGVKNFAEWVDIARLITGDQVLFPLGLISQLPAPAKIN
jgi:ADP-ribose pyrophosphatase YjhB (NUDIX family)